jgi:hypothetical protein
MNLQHQFEKLAFYSYLQPTELSATNATEPRREELLAGVGDALQTTRCASLRLFIQQPQVFWAVLTGNRLMQNT